MNAAACIDAPRIRGLNVVAVNVPLRIPHRTASGTMSHAPLVLVDLLTDAGVAGRAYVFTYTPLALQPVAGLLRALEGLLQDQPLHPQSIEQVLQARFRLLGAQGLVTMALAAIDMAAWDALARWLRLPLACVLGAAPRELPAYASFGMEPVPEAVRQARAAVAQGFGALKLKVGHATWRDDLAVVRAVREAVGPEVVLMVDYNQSLSRPDALLRCRALDGEGLAWIEEPLLHTDVAGHAELRAQLATPLQLGENWWGIADMDASLRAGDSDLVMPDVMKLGGATAWQRAAALAQAGGMPMSSHLFAEFSTHLLSATPTAHWVEVVELAEPILRQTCTLADGRIRPVEGVGAGLEWNGDAVDRFKVT